MAISHVGSFAQNSASATNGTVSVTTVNLGDLVILTDATSSGVAGQGATGVTGGGCATWQQVGTTFVVNSTVVSQISMWWGKVTTVGANQTATVTRTGTPGTWQLDVDQWTAGLGASTVWSWSNFTTKAPTTGAWTGPTLTPSGTALHVGYCVTSGAANGTAGTPSGFSYNQDTIFTACRYYNPASSTAQAGQGTNSGTYAVIAALFTAALPAPPPRRLIVPQAISASVR